MYHGQGTLTKSDKSKYDGEWLAGLKHGAGAMHFASGSKYEGEWKNDLMHGHGMFTSEYLHMCSCVAVLPLLRSLSLSLSLSLSCAQTVQTASSVVSLPTQEYARFVCFFSAKPCIPHALRTMCTPGKTHTYGGGFKEGALHGRGVYEEKGGRRYEGEFVANRRNGKGK